MAQSIVISNTTIGQDEHGRFCLNHLHRAAGGNKQHKPANWLRSDTTQALVAELEKERCSEMSNAINVIQGGQNQGTFAIKELVYDYAMWISPKFKLQVIQAFDEKVTSPTQPSAAAQTGELGAWLTCKEAFTLVDAGKPGKHNAEARMLAVQIFNKMRPDAQHNALQVQTQLRTELVQTQQVVESYKKEMDWMRLEYSGLQGTLINSQSHQIRLMGKVQSMHRSREAREAKLAIIQMTRDGISNAQIVAATGRNLNHVRQVQYQARAAGTLPPLEKEVSTQTGLFGEGA